MGNADAVNVSVFPFGKNKSGAEVISEMTDAKDNRKAMTPDLINAFNLIKILFIKGRLIKKTIIMTKNDKKAESTTGSSPSY